METSRVKNIFLLTVLIVWALVVAAMIINYFVNKGPLPDPIILGIPSATWLAMNPPIPQSMRPDREEQTPNVGN